MTIRRISILAVSAALAAPLLASAPVRAQQQHSVDADVLKKQREAYDRGNKLYDQGKLPEAEAAYLEAWKLKKSYDVAGNLGDIELTNGKPKAAAEHLSYALREFPAGGRPALRDMLVKRLAEAQKQVGLIRLSVNKEGADIYIDGELVGRWPIAGELYVTAGSHLFEARHEDFPSVQHPVTIAKGEQQDVTISLVPKKKSLAVIGAGAGLTAAALGLGVAMIVVSGGKASDADALAGTLKKQGANVCAGSSPPADCATLKGLNEDSDTFQHVALGGFIAAGAIGVATLAYALWPTKKGSSTTTGMLNVVPVVGKATNGLLVSGSF